MRATDLIARARAAAGKNIVYKLGCGGMAAGATSAANHANACDCSGFVCWCLGMCRQTSHPLYMRFNGGWVNTDAMVHDANTETGFFRRLAAPQPGCVIVYPSPGQGKVGHVGIVTAVAGGAVTKVVHCSSGNYRNFGDAIRETPPAVFQRPGTIYAWYEGVDA